jgi:hypothetical protein
MRKFMALAIAGAMTVGVVSFATAGEETQTEVGKVTPTKLDKKKHKNVKFVNTITTFNAPGTNQPPSANRTILDLSKNLKFNNKKWPYCKTDAAGLELAASVEDAKELCGKKSVVSQDSGSTANVRVDLGPGSEPLLLDIQVVAFNENGNKLLLYSKPVGDSQGIPASILVGKLKKSKSGKKYGKALDVTIPPLAAGAISFFEVTIPKSKYIQGRCKSKKMYFQAETFFDGGTSTKDDYFRKCKPKKK